jgi:hypothetical protein
VFVDSLDGTTEDDTTIPYDRIAHRWWRLREHNGTLYWDTSPNNIDWTTRRTKAAGRDYSNEFIQFWVDGSSGSSRFDNLNPVEDITPFVAPAGEPPDVPGADFYIVELAGIANLLDNEKPADKRFAPFVKLIGKVSDEMAASPTQSAVDIPTILAQAQVFKDSYPNDANVDIMLRYAQALAGIWDTDILDHE